MQPARKFLVTFVRHGETFMNSQRLLQGHSDNALSDKGIQQAKQLGESIANTTFTKAYTSDLQRAYNTAKLVLGELSTAIPEVTRDRRLRERCYGEAEGKPVQEYVDMAAKAKVSVQEFVPNGGETNEEVMKRAAEFFDVLCKLSESTTSSTENILVVSHGGWIQSLMKYLYTNGDKYELKNFSPSQAIRIHFNTGVTVISITPQNGTNSNTQYELDFLQVNDVSHLYCDCK